MKRSILFIFLFAALSIVTFSQDVIEGGDMESGNYWDVIDVNEEVGDVEFGYKNNTPSAGKDGALHISGFAINTIVYQEVELNASTYVLDAAFKTIADMNESWNEIQITTDEPEEGVDLNSDFPGYIYLTGFKYATWITECTNSMDVTIADQGDCAVGVGDTIEIEEAGTYYISIKSGGYKEVDVVYDNFSFTDLYPTSIATTSEPNLNVYPNPTTGELFIESETSIQSVVVYSLIGSEIKSLEVTNNKVNVSDLCNGIYLLETVDINNNRGIQKIVKN